MDDLHRALKDEVHALRNALATLMLLPRHIGTGPSDDAETVRQLANTKLQTLRELADRLDAIANHLKRSMS